jgi:hypothetical protein
MVFDKKENRFIVWQGYGNMPRLMEDELAKLLGCNHHLLYNDDRMAISYIPLLKITSNMLWYDGKYSAEFGKLSEHNAIIFEPCIKGYTDTVGQLYELFLNRNVNCVVKVNYRLDFRIKQRDLYFKNKDHLFYFKLFYEQEMLNGN